MPDKSDTRPWRRQLHGRRRLGIASTLALLGLRVARSGTAKRYFEKRKQHDK